MADGVSAGAAVVQTLHPFFEFFVAQAAYISNFEDNLEDLRTALGNLEARRDGVVHRVDAEEIKGQVQLMEVARWRSEVQQTIETNTNLLIPEATLIQQKLSACGCCPIFSIFSCGKRIVKMLEKVRSLMSDFPLVTEPPPLQVVRQEPLQQTFGLATKLQSTWSRLMDDRVRTLGLYGMAGVGKTALLNLIENKFVEVETNFDVVIWVEVHKDANIGKIQNEIGKRLGLYDEKWCQKPEKERASDIRRVLKTKPRFVLLLDDLWEEVCLTTIGIPVRETKYKVVFTTRDKDVMRANESIEVERLAEEDALSLLKQYAGIDILDDQMLRIAKDIVEICLGLPLVLEVIGKCLSSRASADGWRYVLSTLGYSPIELKGTEKIFYVLKSSYDKLDGVEKLCLKFCALFPEAYKIRKDELVEYWIGEGILNEEHGRQRAKDRGCDIIDTLVKAWFILEDGEPGKSKPKVYMRGLIREMALWIVMSGGEKFVVNTNGKLKKLPDVHDYKIVTKISVMNNEIKNITDPLSPSPDDLVTLFLQNNKLGDIDGTFFQVLTTIVVLDLSCNLGITNLPEEIALLVRLRYLNLLGTMIKSLQSLEGLKNLIHLDLESTSNLRDISSVSGLLNLQVLRFYGSASLDHLLLDSFKSMDDLNLLTITIEKDIKVLEAFLESSSAAHTQGLYLDRLDVSGVSGKSFAATFGELGSLSKLGMTECNIIESETEWEDNKGNHGFPSMLSNQSNTWFKNLSTVELYLCKGLQDVTWLIYAENLKSLSVKTSPKMKVLISEEKAAGVIVNPFLNLQTLCLLYLDELKSIYWTPLSFPSLQKVDIRECPNLRKLPLSEERTNALGIEITDGWWLRGVEWERS